MGSRKCLRVLWNLTLMRKKPRLMKKLQMIQKKLKKKILPTILLQKSLKRGGKKRDKRKRMFEEQKKAREQDLKIRETEMARVKSIKKELNAEELQTAENTEKRKEVKKLRCFANLEGLPGAKDPKPIRNFTLKPEERENPIVKDMKTNKIKSGKSRRNLSTAKWIDRSFRK